MVTWKSVDIILSSKENSMNKIDKRGFIYIQIAIILYSLVSVFSKLASIELKSSGIFSIRFMLTVFTMFVILAIYALFWQNILKKVDLSLAYMNKGTVLFWTSIWSFIIFKEAINIKNILGVIIIFLGIIMISRNE